LLKADAVPQANNMWPLRALTYLAFVGFVIGVIDFALEGTRLALTDHEPSWVMPVCAVWLLAAGILKATSD